MLDSRRDPAPWFVVLRRLRRQLLVEAVPDLDIVVAPSKLSDKLDAQSLETRQIVSGLAKRQ